MNLFLIINFFFDYINYFIFYFLSFYFFKKNILNILLENRNERNNKKNLFLEKEKNINKIFDEKILLINTQYEKYQIINNNLLIFKKKKIKEDKKIIEEMNVKIEKNIDNLKMKNQFLIKNKEFENFKNNFYKVMKNETEIIDNDFFCFNKNFKL